MIIMHDDKQMRYSNTIAVVEQCGCALCEQVPTNLVLLLMDSSKSRKASVAAVRLAKTNMDKIWYFCSCGNSDHTNKDRPLKQK